MTIYTIGSFPKWFMFCLCYFFFVFSFFFLAMLGKKALELPSFFLISFIVLMFVGSAFFAAAIKLFSDSFITQNGITGSLKKHTIAWDDVTNFYSVPILPVYFVQGKKGLIPLIIPRPVILEDSKTVKEGMNKLLNEHPTVLQNLNAKMLIMRYLGNYNNNKRGRG